MQKKQESYLEEKKGKERGNGMSGIWVFLVIIVLWFILQAYILPKFGIST